jgi:hypothetical protein
MDADESAGDRAGALVKEEGMVNWQINPENVALVSQGPNWRVLIVYLAIELGDRSLVPGLVDAHGLLRVGDRVMVKHRCGWCEDMQVAERSAGIVRLAGLGRTLDGIREERRLWIDKIAGGGAHVDG